MYKLNICDEWCADEWNGESIFTASSFGSVIAQADEDKRLRAEVEGAKGN